MNAWKRLLIAATVVLSGMALVPFVALPSETFSWTLFTNAYGSTPVLTTNYATGGPGSFFRVTGYNFPAGGSVTVEVNDRPLGIVSADQNGNIAFILETGSASLGSYLVSATFTGSNNQSDGAVTRFELIAGGPVRAQEGAGVVFFVPPGLVSQSLYLPMIRR